MANHDKMPVCSCCGEEKFECIDGLFYCQQCQTQTQEMRVEQQEDGGQLHVKLILRPHRVVEKTTSADTDKGRSWFTHEAFTLILREQTKALVKLGADPKLEDVVLRLWMRYLSLSGTAFGQVTCADQLRRSTTKAGKRMRDELAADGVPDPKRIRHRVQTAKQKDGHAKHLEELAEIATLLAGEEFYEGDDPAQVATTEPLPLEDDDDDFVQQVRQGKSIYDKGYMTMRRTLVFLYLGLHHTNNLVMPFDLIRWVWNGYVPFGRTIGGILPDDMRFHNGDTRIFCAGFVPQAARLRLESGAFAHYLGLTSLPPVDLVLLTSRFIIELNLPGELHSLTHALIHCYPISVKFRCQSIVSYEKFAMAYVVLILKLLFGVNDHREQQLSAYAKSVNETQSPVQRLFVWEEWVQYMEQQIAIAEQDMLPMSVMDVKRMRDLTPCLRTYQETNNVAGKFAKKRTRFHLRTDDLRLSMQRPFKQLLSRRPAAEGQQQTSTPNFGSCSLRYLTDDPAFIAVPKSQDLLDTATGSGDDNDSVDTSQDLFASEASACDGEVGVSRPGGINARHHLAACEQYAVYGCKSVKPRHRAYDQLLHFCDSCCHCGTDVLHDALQRLQLGPIVTHDNLPLNERNIWRRFVAAFLK